MGFEFTAIGVLSIIAFIGLIAAILVWQSFGQRRAERDLVRSLQAGRQGTGKKADS